MGSETVRPRAAARVANRSAKPALAGFSILAGVMRVQNDAAGRSGLTKRAAAQFSITIATYFDMPLIEIDPFSMSTLNKWPEKVESTGSPS
jgi:hypothetical protein